MKGSRRRWSKRQREGERNRDGKIVQEWDTEAKKSHIYMIAVRSGWKRRLYLPSPLRHTKEPNRPGIVGKWEVWAMGALFTTEKIGWSCKHTLSSQESWWVDLSNDSAGFIPPFILFYSSPLSSVRLLSVCVCSSLPACLCFLSGPAWKQEPLTYPKGKKLAYEKWVLPSSADDLCHALCAGHFDGG